MFFISPPFYMTCYAIRGGLTNLKLLGMVWDQIMDYSAKFQLKIPYYFRVIDVFLYDPPFYMTCYAIRGGSDQPENFLD